MKQSILFATILVCVFSNCLSDDIGDDEVTEDDSDLASK